jgi:Uncharacterized protein conserved in bacteria (DUF2188)
MSTKLYVLPVRGGWGIVAEGRRRPMLQHSTRSRAVALAREAALRQGGGEVLVLNRSGEVIDSKAVRREPSG